MFDLEAVLTRMAEQIADAFPTDGAAQLAALSHIATELEMARRDGIAIAEKIRKIDIGSIVRLVESAFIARGSLRS